MWGYADGHCDTIVKLLEEKKSFFVMMNNLILKKCKHMLRRCRFLQFGWIPNTIPAQCAKQ